MKSINWVLWGLAAALIAAGPTRPATRPANGAATRASFEALVQQGLEAMAARQMDAAREAFHDALALDRNHRLALHGLAVCQMNARDMGHAKENFEKVLAQTPKPDRALVNNAAAFFQTTRATLRGTKLIKDYLAANSAVLDEPMVNALGSLLSSASAADRKTRLYTDAVSFYMIVNQRLEQARPGQKRFGDQWLPEAECAARVALWQAREQEVAAAADAVAAAEDKLADAEDYVALCRSKLRWSKSAKIELPKGEAAVAQAQRDLDAKVAAMEKIMAQVARPTFPRRIPIVALDATRAPDLSIAATPATGPASRPVAVAIVPATRPASVQPPSTPVTPVVTQPVATVAANLPRPAVPVSAIPARRARVTHYAAGFAIAPDLIITSAQAVPEGATIQVQCPDGNTLPATLLRADRNLGLALVRIQGRRMQPLALADQFAGGAVACAAFPAVDLFNPTPRVLRGNAGPAAKDSSWTIALAQHPRLSGSPILSGDRVVGVCVAPRDAELGKLPAITLEQLRAFAAADADPRSPAPEPTPAMVQVVTTLDGAE